jgi:hypothetical protein
MQITSVALAILSFRLGQPNLAVLKDMGEKVGPIHVFGNFEKSLRKDDVKQIKI